MCSWEEAFNSKTLTPEITAAAGSPLVYESVCCNRHAVLAQFPYHGACQQPLSACKAAVGQAEGSGMPLLPVLHEDAVLSWRLVVWFMLCCQGCLRWGGFGASRQKKGSQQLSSCSTGLACSVSVLVVLVWCPCIECRGPGFTQLQGSRWLGLSIEHELACF